MPLLSFPCYIILPKTSRTMLTNVSENRYPCLALNIREKAFNFSHTPATHAHVCIYAYTYI